MKRVAIAIVELMILLSVVSVLGHVFVEYETDPGPGDWTEARIVVEGPVNPNAIPRDANVLNYTELPPSEKKIFAKAEKYGTLTNTGVYEAEETNLSLMSAEYVNWNGGHYSVLFTMQEKPLMGKLVVGIRHFIKLGLGVVCAVLLVAGLSDVIVRCGRWRDVTWAYEKLRG